MNYFLTSECDLHLRERRHSRVNHHVNVTAMMRFITIPIMKNPDRSLASSLRTCFRPTLLCVCVRSCVGVTVLSTTMRLLVVALGVLLGSELACTEPDVSKLVTVRQIANMCNCRWRRMRYLLYFMGARIAFCYRFICNLFRGFKLIHCL